MRHDAGFGAEGTPDCRPGGGSCANLGLEFFSFASSTSSTSSTSISSTSLALSGVMRPVSSFQRPASRNYPSLLSGRRPDEGRRPERASRARELSSACYFPLYFYPLLLPSRNVRKPLKTNDPCASYPSLESTLLRGALASCRRRETVSRTASRRGRIPLSNRTPAKEPSR
jgi:hypothetical protein